MDQKKLHRIIAFVVFLISAFIFFITAQPSVSFWDCGEFTASSYLLQVPHPPGTPFFIILGRFFTMLPFAANIGFRVNTISVLASAFAVLFLYLIAVKLIELYKNRQHTGILDALGTYMAAAIGALSFAFSDTFWFNAVESEVYATATFFAAIVVWLIMVWNEKADEPGSEKYLVLIAYLVGLSTGVHLMSLLTLVPIVMIVIFKKYVTDEVILKNSGYIFLGHAVIILLIAMAMWAAQTDSAPPSPDQYKSIDSKFLMVFAGISVLYIAGFRKKIFQRNSIYLPLAVGAIFLFGTYPGMVKYVPKLISAVAGDNMTADIIAAVAIFAILGYGIYWAAKNNKPTANLIFKCAFFALVGFTSYTMIIIRANEEPPINMNSPKNFSEAEAYLNREQYGDFPEWKRRYSQEPNQQAIYTDYSSDLDFVLSYQINHMFNRYLFWNYIGRDSTVQDAGVDLTELFGIPFLFGLFGLYYHFRKDWKMATAFLVMFIFLGYLTAFYQNQQQPQPRERDYFYVGAFFVFSIWIALGFRGVLDLITKQLKNSTMYKPLFSLMIVVGFIIIPANMLHANFFEHNRSRNYVPWDYSYNMLQSVAPNAILFTNGDNDTFPLWYLQDVEGVRRDVRIANLSLMNTPWYVKQLKNVATFDADKVPMTIPDEHINDKDLTAMRWDPQQMSLPVPKEVFQQFGVTDTSVINSGKMTWKMNNTIQFGDIKAIRIQDIVTLNIIIANNWKRPIYFATTTSDDSKLGLQNYLSMEGMAFRLTPKRVDRELENLNPEIMHKQLFNDPQGFSKTYQPGFKFRGLDDPSIFLNDNHIHMMQNYRNTFIRLAYYDVSKNKNAEAASVLDEMEKRMPRNVIPMDYRIEHDIANIYYRAGAMPQYMIYAQEVIAAALKQVDENPRDFNSWYNPYEILLTHYNNLKEYDNAVAILKRLQLVVPNDPSVRTMLTHYQMLASGSDKDTSEVQQKTIK